MPQPTVSSTIQVRPEARLFRGLIDFNRTLRAQAQVWGAIGDHGLSRNEVVVLGLLADHEGCRASLVADRMHVGPSVVSRLVSALESRHLLAREPDPEDGRAEALRPTAAGARALENAREGFIDALSQRLESWDESRVNAAAELLEDLTAALSATPTGGQVR